ncbi:MAG: hypothetical protein ACPG3Z_07165 [Saprospiraceae bacterium]
MNHNITINDTADLIATDFEMSPSETPFLTEKDLLQALSEHVEMMMKYRMEILLSTLYRLDVSERKVNLAMSPGATLPPHIGIAQLIIDRQKQRLHTKATYKTEPLEDWMDF